MSEQKRNSSATLMFIGGSLIGLVICFFLWKTIIKPYARKGDTHAEVSEGDSKELLRISGSNTIGAKLMPEMVKAFMKEHGYEDLKVTESEGNEIRVSGNTKHKVDHESGAGHILIHSEGSENAFKDLSSNTAGIGMSSRPVNDTEAAQLSSKGDIRSHLNEHILGLDGIAVIVSGNNPLRNISKPQLQAIFSGAVNNWSQVSTEKSGMITIYGRDAKSGTYGFFQTSVMGGNSFAPGIKEFNSNETLSEALSKDPNGIGYVPLNNVGNNKALAVSEEDKLIPLHPNPFTIATEDYPLSRRLYLYRNPTAENIATEFIHFALSDEGEKIVEKNGFVSTELKTASAKVVIADNVNVPVEYKNAINGASRENFNVHFLTGSSTLDNKALDDIERLAAHWNKPEYKGKQVQLLGFTDDQGSHASNQKLAENRALAVSGELKSHGINNVSIIGLGEIMPVSSNLTPQGREKNRRVEVWVK